MLETKMLGLPDRMTPWIRAVLIIAACATAVAIAGADRYLVRMQLATLEIVPVAMLAWLLPLAVSLPLALALAAGVAWEEVPGGYQTAGETLFEAALSLAIAYVSPVVLVTLLRRAMRRRVETSEAQYRAIGDAIPYGVWSATTDGEMLYVSPSYLAILGAGRIDGSAFAPLAERAAAAHGRPFEWEHDVVAAAGERRWVLTRGVPVSDARGVVRRFVGINLDITERKTAEASMLESEERYRYLTASIPQIVWTCDAQARIEYFNERWYAYTGMTLGDPIRGAFTQRLHPADRRNSFLAWVASGRRSEETYEAEVRLRSASGVFRWFLSRAVAQTDPQGNVLRWLGTSTDIDARKRAQDQLTFLARAADSLTETLDVEGTCKALAHLAVPSLADYCAVFLLEGDERIRTLALEHDDPARLHRAWAMERRYTRTLHSGDIVAAAIRTGELQSAGFDDPVARRTFAQDDTHSRILESLSFGAAICVPMRSGIRTIGAIVLIHNESGRNFEPEDYEIARELARRATIAVENARAYDRERRVADALQSAFLPATLPRIPGLEFDAVYAPAAGESAIGGDWYDAFQLADGRVVLSIGDVAGRGLHAAVVMGRVREAIRAFALQGLAPAQILAAAQRVLRLSEAASMVTAFVAVAHPLARTLTFSNAGHPPPLLAHPGGDIESLELEGIPLGIFEEIAPQQKSIALPDDALLVLYTDGLIELDRDVVGGLRRLREAVANAMRNGRLSAGAIYRELVEMRPAADDIAVLTLATKRLAREPLMLELSAVPESARIVRLALERFAAAYGFDADRRFALEVAAGEAVANAIEHAYGIGSGRFSVRAVETGAALEVEITDTGQWRAPRNEGRGRGVPIMRALAADVHIESGAGGTVVRMTFPVTVEERART
ncbi:MAG: SpoIIE family protein phosphatase [Candidatus Velthaea sp.]